jgi:hypothetical protein
LSKQTAWMLDIDLNSTKLGRMDDVLEPPGRSYLLSQEWRAATPAERKIALVLFVAFEEANPNAFVLGNPATEEATIDGHFDLLAISRRLIPILEST